MSGAIAGGVFGGMKYLLSASKIARGLSGLKSAEENFSKAAQLLKNTPIEIKNGVMATERVAAQLGYDVASVTLGHAQSIYNGIKLATDIFYRMAQFGFKQLIGGLFN